MKKKIKLQPKFTRYVVVREHPLVFKIVDSLDLNKDILTITVNDLRAIDIPHASFMNSIYLDRLANKIATTMNREYYYYNKDLEKFLNHDEK